MSRLLGGHGYRVLYSVFELEFPRSAMPALVRRLEVELRPGDHLLLLPRCPDCREAGRGPGIEGPRPVIA